MLVLSRKKGEAIEIGESISVVVLDTCGARVRLGIRAPAEIPVHRREVKEAIDRAGKESEHRAATGEAQQ